MTELDIDKLRSGCYRVAKQLEERAAKADSWPDDKEAAELAARVIQLAERKAAMIPKDWAEADLSAFLREITSIEEAFREKFPSAAPFAAEALQTAALADLAKAEQRLRQSLDLRVWDAWSEANELLAQLLALYPLRTE